MIFQPVHRIKHKNIVTNKDHFMISTSRPVYFSGWLKDELSVQYEDVLPILHLPVICIRKSPLCGHIAGCIRLEFPVVDQQENRRGLKAQHHVTPGRLHLHSCSM